MIASLNETGLHALVKELCLNQADVLFVIISSGLALEIKLDKRELCFCLLASGASKDKKSGESRCRLLRGDTQIGMHATAFAPSISSDLPTW